MELAAILISFGALLITVLGIAYAHGKIEQRMESKLEVLSRNYGDISHRLTRVETRLSDLDATMKAYYKTRLQSGEKPNHG